MSDQEQGNIPPKATPAAPGAPRPITVRLKPITPAATNPAAPPSETASSADPGTTVKLTPVVLTPVTPPAPVTAPTPVAAPGATSPSATSAIPTPTTAQVQASKSKTSRISLDSAIGATSIPIKPADAGGPPKTIRLKRPSDLSAPMSPVTPITSPTAKSGTAPIRQTSRIPDSVLPTDAGADLSSTVTQKKTLKIKRPGADTAATDDTSMDGIQMMPITDYASAPAGPQGFTIFAIVLGSIAAILLIALSFCLASDALGPASGKVVADVPWPGKFVQPIQ
ncbi:MAG: hypothetical protein FWH21_04000 [Kiritimatiellaeota bacterium]|nr:hypothetical protein [Kiritimatiellota bacterium]